ncbi:MAG: hypothetical protein D6772_08500 [Bacteroidetes bacterium]|nr:MAG: hypothetical protein D6772_08500 [Bacteroidota bacterium]
MDKIFHSTFDFFTHALPGFCLVASLFILHAEVTSPSQLLELANDFEIGSGIFLLIIAYIVGFAIYPLGRALYRSLGFRLWERKIHHHIPLFISEKYVLLREYSPANFKYVELWNMFCAMAHNLAVASLVLVVGCAVKCVISWSYEWLFIALVAFALTFVFLHRAVVFAVWAADDINSTIKQLGLANRMPSSAKRAAK